MVKNAIKVQNSPDFIELCQKSIPKAVDTVIDVMKNGKNDRARLEAAKFMIERVHGKADQNHKHEFSAEKSFLDALKKINETPSITTEKGKDGKIKVIEHIPEENTNGTKAPEQLQDAGEDILSDHNARDWPDENGERSPF